MTINEGHRIAWLLKKAIAIRKNKGSIEIDFTDENLARDLQDLFWHVRAQEFSNHDKERIH